jgi:hypothetical protein
MKFMTHLQTVSPQDERNSFKAGKSSLSPHAYALASLAVVLLTGCGYSGFPLTGGGTTPPAKPSEIGNWQVEATSTAGTSPFSALAGWIYEPTSTTAATQSVFQVTPDQSSCFRSATTLPSQGTLSGTALTLNGFSVNAQFVTINATQDATASHFTGTYVVRGGCANGATGTLSGTRYSALTGTYQGVLASGQTLALTTKQDDYPDGLGYFPISGTATVPGSSCLAGATINDATSTVIGSTASLSLVGTTGATFQLTGTLKPDATSIAVTAIKLVSGTCQEQFSTGTLSRQ